MGLSMAATATVSRRIGEKDAEGAALAAVQALAVGVATAFLFSAAGVAFGPWLLRAMGATPGVLQLASFTRVMLGGSVTVFLLFLINAAFRGAGDAAIAMRSLWLANAFNIVLGPLFIFGVGPFPKLGVTGAAVATTVGRGLGVAYQLYELLGGRGRLAVRLRHLRIDAAVMKALVRLASSGVFQMMVGTASWLALLRILAPFGSTVLAGYTVGIRIVMFALLPAWGLSNAVATLVGQNLGANRAERAERSVWIAARIDGLFLGAVGLVFILFPRQFVGLLNPDPATVDVGAQALRIIAIGFPFYGFSMVMEGAFNGAGDTWTPTVLNFICFWAWEIPLAWALTHFGSSYNGVFIAITVAFSTLAILAMLWFRRGRWKKIVV
jgi:putative MATE family efflux protein